MKDQTDRELLEAAAKAAGIDLQTKPMFGGDAEPGYYAYRGEHCEWVWWNSLTDDGDALRLAVKLNLHAARTSIFRVSCWAEKAPFDADGPGSDTHREVSECWFGDEMREYAARYGLNWRQDQLAATRLTISLAAATIGATK